jgi:hypothetical protein
MADFTLTEEGKDAIRAFLYFASTRMEDVSEQQWVKDIDGEVGLNDSYFVKRISQEFMGVLSSWQDDFYKQSRQEQRSPAQQRG